MLRAKRYAAGGEIGVACGVRNAVCCISARGALRGAVCWRGAAQSTNHINVRTVPCNLSLDYHYSAVTLFDTVPVFFSMLLSREACNAVAFSSVMPLAIQYTRFISV